MTTESTSEPTASASLLLGRGILLLVVSFFLALIVANIHHSATAAAVVGWCENVAFWLGIVHVGADLVARIFRRPVW